MDHSRINFLSTNKPNFNKKTHFKLKYNNLEKKNYYYFYEKTFCNYYFKPKNCTTKFINVFNIFYKNKVEFIFFF